jgi:hypothetical protein
MDGLGTFADELKHCVDIPLGRHRLAGLSLERLLASKLAANRAKGRLTIPVLRDALAAIQAGRRRPTKKARRPRSSPAKASNAPGRRQS